eukprot:8955392-Ditylum_brightwellii.AAC.1
MLFSKSSKHTISKKGKYKQNSPVRLPVTPPPGTISEPRTTVENCLFICPLSSEGVRVFICRPNCLNKGAEQTAIKKNCHEKELGQNLKGCGCTDY